MRSSTLARVLGVLIVAIVVGGLIGWWASRPSRQSTAPTPEPPAPVVTTEPTVVPTATTNADVAPAPAVTANTNSFDPALWDDKLDEILGDADDDTDRKARQLLDMMDKVSVEAQTEIAGHIVNLVDDKDF